MLERFSLSFVCIRTYDSIRHAITNTYAGGARKKEVVKMYRKLVTSAVGVMLLVGGSALVAPAVAQATTPTSVVVYDSTTSPQPGNLPSEAFEATQTVQLGNEVAFAPNTSRVLTQAVVQMSSWGCQNGTWQGGCTTTPGATFSEPITLNIFNVGANNTVGSLITSVTQTFNIPYRPSADPTKCAATPTEWYSTADAGCDNGLTTNITFNLSNVTVPDSVIYGIAYNTSDYGAAPYGDNTACHATPQGCGYDSLNVGLTVANGPSVGTDPLPGTVFQNTGYGPFYCDSGAAGVGTFRLDSPNTTPCWGTDPSNNYSQAPWYIPAVQFSAALTSQSISYTSTAPTGAVVGGSYQVSATATSGLPMTFASASPSNCTISGSTVSFVGPGFCNIVAFQNGNGVYSAATPLVQTFTIELAQSITFTSSPPSSAYPGGPTYTVTARASSGLPVIFGSASASTCTTTQSGVVSFVGAGTCNIVAFQLGNSTYGAATPVVQSFTVLAKTVPSFSGDASSGTAYLLIPFSATISATGLPTPSVSVVSGLPLGLSATSNANGSVTIHGLPLLFGTYSIKVAATSSASATPVYFTYTLRVNL